MSKGGMRTNRELEKMVGRIDRERETRGYRGGAAFEEGEKKRLHQCQPGDWIREVLQGEDHYGPPLRVLDPESGLLENRKGVRSKIAPRTQVMVQV
ncbi:MAG: hypothetical protein H6683_09265 [Deltaproteobacteria bacterium]|nr:hypothetical protein [Deltaproteobacteria bacterium]MCB9479858.1 hypothetical protein [Deltaproteobacteria bacterium]